jgi:hypothetical protein
MSGDPKFDNTTEPDHLQICRFQAGRRSKILRRRRLKQLMRSWRSKIIIQAVMLAAKGQLRLSYRFTELTMPYFFVIYLAPCN